MKFSFLSDFNRIFSLFDNKFKIKYLILILLSIIASVFEFFSISLLIPLVSSFTGENDLLNNFPETEYIYELLDKQLEYVAETVKNMIVIVNDLINSY